jgi:hypothetical protein
MAKGLSVMPPAGELGVAAKNRPTALQARHQGAALHMYVSTRAEYVACTRASIVTGVQNQRRENWLSTSRMDLHAGSHLQGRTSSNAAA